MYYRYGVPQAKLLLESSNQSEYEMAGILFGKENLLDDNNIEEQLAPYPITLFCNDESKNDSINGFSMTFCQGQVIQTDIGMCVGKDSNHLANGAKIQLQEQIREVENPLLYAEHVYVISTNGLIDVNDQANIKVPKKYFYDKSLTYQLFLQIICFVVGESKNNKKERQNTISSTVNKGFSTDVIWK